MKVEPKKIKDINENDKYYVIIHNYGKRVTINIRKKTWEQLEELANQKQLDIQLDEDNK